MSSEVDVRLLGSLGVYVDGRPVQLGGAKQRTLFTALALRAPNARTVDELIDMLWSGRPPPGGAHALQKQVSRLRRRLGGGAPVYHRAAGYALAIDRGALDLRRFEDLLGRARFALTQDDAASAAAHFEAGLALWRGPALADHRFERFAQVEIARLEELRLEAIEERMAAELTRGRDTGLVGQLRALVAEHPLRERLRAHLMLALYRSARQADALEAMRDGRRALVEELGIEPGPELRRLERMILAHDPSLTAGLPRRAPPAALPVPVDVLIGRDGELAEVVDLLMRPGARLVTLVGAGGVGKTRLALEAARRVGEHFAGGVVYVDLDVVVSAQGLVSAAAGAMAVVAPTPGEPAERLSRGARGAPVLLLLDGFERLLDGVGEVARVLAADENVTVLATSRAVLRLSGEHVYIVHPLALPTATELFSARASAARAGWALDDDDREIVAAICARLDGLPLAIELAANRVRFLPLRGLLGRLDRRLEILTEGVSDRPPRQRSLRATLEWSWEVLDAIERRLLCLLTVFEGGASLEAAEAVCAPALGRSVHTVLASLLDKTSLLRADARADEPRFGMLDTMGEFAAERAADVPELAATELRHARYFLGYCEWLATQAAGAHRRDALGRLVAERANIRLAHGRLLRAGEGQAALRVAIAVAKALRWDAGAGELRGWLGDGPSALASEPSALGTTALYSDGTLAIS